jgi:hypothetical protein
VFVNFVSRRASATGTSIIEQLRRGSKLILSFAKSA